MNHAQSSTSPTSLAPGTAKFVANVLLVIGIALLGVSMLWSCCDSHHFAFAWLFSFLFFFTIVAGSIFWTVIHHATHAAWSTILRRQWENLASLIPLMMILFIPLIFHRETLYHWMRDDVATSDPEVTEKAWYLTAGFFYLRAVIFFLIFAGITTYYRKASLQQDSDGSPVHSANLQEKSYVLLAIYGLALTFASFDWIMSLNYHWSSTMFGVTIFAGSALASVAVVILVTVLLQSLGYLKEINKEHYHLLGKVQFSFVLFWAWVSFGQYLFIWYANIPEETDFFIDRNKGSWALLTALFVILKFAVPFVILLMQWTKRSKFWLVLTASSILVGHALELYWLVFPTIDKNGWTPQLVDGIIWLGMAALFISVFIRRMVSVPLYPVRDPRLAECLEVYN